MFEQAFRNIDDVLRKEAGCTTELDYAARGRDGAALDEPKKSLLHQAFRGNP